MIKLMQILKWMKNKGFKLDKVMEELTEIIDNEQSQYFQLSPSDIQSISKVFHDDAKFESALQAAGFHGKQGKYSKEQIEKVAKLVIAEINKIEVERITQLVKAAMTPKIKDIPFEEYAKSGSKFLKVADEIEQNGTMNMHVADAIKKKVSSKEMEKEIKLAIKMHSKYDKQPGSSPLHSAVTTAMWTLLGALRESI